MISSTSRSILLSNSSPIFAPPSISSPLHCSSSSPLSKSTPISNSISNTLSRFSGREEGQLVLAGGVALAFAILLIAGLTQLGTDMDADRDIEPSLGPEFVHVRIQFENAVQYNYEERNESAQEAFTNSAELFVNMQIHYGVILDFETINITGTPGNETVEFRMEMVSKEQLLWQEGTIVLTR